MVHPDDLSDAAPVRPIVSLIALVAAAGAFTFGYDIVIRSGAILFLEDDFPLSPGGKGFAMTSATLGVIAGLLIAAPVADRTGRKWTLILAAILFMRATWVYPPGVLVVRPCLYRRRKSRQRGTRPQQTQTTKDLDKF